MAGRIPSLLSAKIKVMPGVARQEILDAIVVAEGDFDEAAYLLNVSLRTLYRYVQQLRMYSDIDESLARCGFPPLQRGPERKYT